jgi:signal transduction histidine kinase
METRTARRIVWPAVGLFALLAPVGLYLVASSRGDAAEDAVFAAIFLAMASIGALIASRRPETPIGWLLLFSACVIAIAFTASSYVIYGYGEGDRLPFLRWMAWLSSWPWPLAIGVLLTFLLLLFPDGRLPSRRWRPVAWASGAAIALVCIATALMPGRLDGTPATNPIGIPGAGRFLDAAAGTGFLALTVLSVASVASLLVRFRRSVGEERKQIAWFLFAAALLVVDILIDTVIEALGVARSPWFLTVLDALAFVSIPAAVGIAILKYRLYDIDTVIKKSVVIGLLAAFITSVYLAVVVGIGALVGSRRNIFLSILATAIIALAFQPIRERVRRLADRLVYGERATPYEVLSDFSERAAGTYSTEDVLPRMVKILAGGTGASEARVWLRVGSELRVGAAWPADSVAAPVRIAGDNLPDFGERERAFPVRHGGELLGAITVVAPPNDPLTPDKEKLLSDAAAQTGLILRNVRLLEELRESRRRIVTAQDERAKALERNIHDGAQQQLVALTVKLRLLEQLAPRDGAKAAQMAAQLQSEATEALEDLRDLARGIYPPLLADKGLTAALEAQARKSSLPVSVSPDGVARYPQEVESAVYFSCLEALQNVAKYAHASRAQARLWASGGELTFEVTDDGAGFDPSATPRGSGLQGMADRLDAIGGTLEVRSQPGMGTTVTGRVPVPQGPA